MISKPLTYELLNCDVNGQRYILNGIKIDVKQDIKRITDSGSYDAKGFSKGDRTIDFSFTDPRDVEIAHKLYDDLIDKHELFDVMLYSKNVNTGAWDVVASLQGCILNKIDHNIKAKEEWKPGVSGMALKFSRVNYQFNPEEINIVSEDTDVADNDSSEPQEG